MIETRTLSGAIVEISCEGRDTLEEIAARTNCTLDEVIETANEFIAEHQAKKNGGGGNKARLHLDCRDMTVGGAYVTSYSFDTYTGGPQKIVLEFELGNVKPFNSSEQMNGLLMALEGEIVE